MAAAWTEHHLAERFVMAEIRSAGTHAWDGAEAGAYAIDAMRELGHDMREHRSQPITQDLLDWAEFVVIMQPMHEEAIQDRLDASKIVRLWDYVEGADRIVDPQGHPLPAFAAAAASIRDATALMVAEHLAARRARRQP